MFLQTKYLNCLLCFKSSPFLAKCDKTFLQSLQCYQKMSRYPGYPVTLVFVPKGCLISNFGPVSGLIRDIRADTIWQDYDYLPEAINIFPPNLAKGKYINVNRYFTGTTTLHKPY